MNPPDPSAGGAPPQADAPNERASAPHSFEKLERLRAALRDLGSALVCYSGGVDSALVLAVAHETLRERAVGLTAVSPSLAPFEKEAAVAIARHIGARHELVESHEIDRPGYVANAPDRCFYCKSELYEIAEQKRAEWGMAHVLNGTNLDDLGDHRPGLDAAARAGVRSVLVECGFHKDDVRRAALEMNLAVWDKPASACLSSRIPYGTEVTRERLAQIGGLEAELRALGLRQVRVRWHEVRSALQTTGNEARGAPAAPARAERALARVEVARDELPRAFDLRDAIVDAGKRFGFAYVTLDLQGYRTGSHNEVIVGRSLRLV
ncbi:MAG: ATP-dependent sacrificial sulfur transferase LarE [Myxococcales bacterium]|nr:ATP-dependent sacrificial sulfur transferase LarE [Myxococcales bacterium]